MKIKVKLKAQDKKIYLYHATYGKYLNSIMKDGLIPNKNINWDFSERYVYLTTDPDIAESFAETSEMAPEKYLNDIVILKVYIKDLDINKLRLDNNITQEGEEFYDEYDEPYSFQYEGKINPQYISIHKRIKAQDNKIYSGKEIADYFRDITEIDESITKIGLENLIKNYVMENKWELKSIAISEVLKDPDFEQFWNNIDSEEDLYEDYYDRNFDDWELNQPIILYQKDNKTFLVDGYHRTAQRLLNEESNIKAYVVTEKE